MEAKLTTMGQENWEGLKVLEGISPNTEDFHTKEQQLGGAGQLWEGSG